MVVIFDAVQSAEAASIGINQGETQKTSRVTAHRANHSVWESLIFEEECNKTKGATQ